jgi:hypothetical protein
MFSGTYLTPLDPAPAAALAAAGLAVAGLAACFVSYFLGAIVKN